MTHVPRSAACALLLVSLVACSKSPSGPGSSAIEAATLKRRDPARVRVEPVVSREMLRVLETTTRVESENQVEVMPRSSGLVTQVLVEEGSPVKEGEILARLDAREFAIAVADAEVALEDARAAEPRLDLARREAEAKLATAQRSYEQVQRDFERNEAIARASPGLPALLSPKDLDASRLSRDNALAEAKNAELAVERARLDQENAKTTARRAELTLERARLNLANMDITAPFAGILAARGIRVGDTVSASTSAFTLTDLAHLRAVFYRPQRELGLFLRNQTRSEGTAAKPGDGPRAAEVELFASAEALPGRRFRGTIERIAPTIDPQSGNFRVTAALDGAAEGEPGPLLLPGMLVRLEIITERHANALVIPKRALRREGDSNMVFVVRDGKAVRVGIREGLADNESLEVTPLAGARLEAGDSVVVVGNRDLEDGSEVTVADQVETADETPSEPVREATLDADVAPAPAVQEPAAPHAGATTEQTPPAPDAPAPKTDSPAEPEPVGGH